MLGYAGPQTDFPTIGVGREPGATSDWIVQHAREPRRMAGSPPELPPGSEIDEFMLPVAIDLPHDVAVTGSGKILATGMFTHQIWILDPATGAWDHEPIPVPDANPRAVEMALPRQGGAEAEDWWVLLGVPNMLAHRDASTGAWETFPIGFYGHSVAVDGRGRVWFNSHFNRDPGIIGFLDPADETITTFEIPTPIHLAGGGTPILYGLRVAPDGTVWGTELRGNRLVHVDPETGAVSVYSMPLESSGPRRPDVDQLGVLWIPEYAGNALTRFDPETATFTRFPLPLADALPYVVRVDNRRARIWIGTAAADAVLMFDPEAEEFTIYPLPSRGALVRHLDIDDTSGEVWLAYGASPGIDARVARLRP